MLSFDKTSIFLVFSFVLSVSILSAQPPDELFLKGMSKVSDTNLLSLKNSRSKPVFDFNSNAETPIDDRLIGSWQIRYRGNYCSAALEFSLDEDGTYTSTAACDDGSLPLQTIGAWRLVRQGLIEVEYSDWEPKYDASGQPIKFPRIEKTQYKFINNNRMTFGGKVATRIG